ncbi:MAG: hypothetical protein FD145_1010 [Candidatus Saganbacteria bacterium]|uniref:YggT family protein n=1 Tax=Candidatus Saganbacteria bacterium TaxID=2575572 RepID=A0A833L0N1_UNCSA|nr:MAG: hypothetical protein FD145_1010 [Candidatus Saganbacteria bacterium]
MLILIRAMLPFVPHNREHLKLIYEITDLVMIPIRQGLPPNKLGFDASPFILIFVFAIIQRLIIYLLGGFQ